MCCWKTANNYRYNCKKQFYSLKKNHISSLLELYYRFTNIFSNEDLQIDSSGRSQMCFLASKCCLGKQWGGKSPSVEFRKHKNNV